jgi:hypothetical protein
MRPASLQCGAWQSASGTRCAQVAAYCAVLCVCCCWHNVSGLQCRHTGGACSWFCTAGSRLCVIARCIAWLLPADTCLHCCWQHLPPHGLLLQLQGSKVAVSIAYPADINTPGYAKENLNKVRRHCRCVQLALIYMFSQQMPGCSIAHRAAAIMQPTAQC